MATVPFKTVETNKRKQVRIFEWTFFPTELERGTKALQFDAMFYKNFDYVYDDGFITSGVENNNLSSFRI